MAEETTSESTETQQQSSGIDEAKLAELIAKSQQDSIKATLAELRRDAEQQQQYQQQQTQQTEVQPTFWDEQINPRLAPVQRQTQFAMLRAEAAEDKADFYGSDEWTELVESYCTADTDEELNTQKKELRTKIEETFNNRMKSGNPIPRKDISEWLLGQEIKTNKTKHVEAYTKKRKKAEESELEKARRAVDIGAGNVVNFQPEEVHAMTLEDMQAKYSTLTF